MNEEEKKRLNESAGKILREAGLDFEMWKDYDWIKKTTKDVGYADYYLVRSWNDSKKINEADATVYQKLVDIDTRIGTKLSEQLFCCLCWTTRWDIIKVFLHFLKLITDIHNYQMLNTACIFISKVLKNLNNYSR